jgi:hypothetical protein
MNNREYESEMDNPEKLATLGIQDKQKHTQYVVHHYAQTNTNDGNSCFYHIFKTFFMRLVI